MTAKPPPRGFTLIEVLAALAVGGVVFAMLGKTFGVVATANGSLAAARDQRDRVAGGARRVAAALNSVIPPTDSVPFLGDSARVVFSAMIRQPDSSFARRRVQLVTGAVLPSADLVLAAPMPAGWAGAFDFLAGAGLPFRWVTSWRSGVQAPAAVRLRTWMVGRLETTGETIIWPVRDR